MSKLGYCVMDTNTNTCYVIEKEFESDKEIKSLNRKIAKNVVAINGCDSVWYTNKDAEERCTKLNQYHVDLQKLLKKWA